MPSYIKTDTHITVLFDDGETGTAYKQQDNYNTIVQAIRDGDWQLVREELFPVEKIQEETTKNIDDNITINIDHGVVYFNNEPLHNSLTTRMIDMVNEGFDITPLSNFLLNLMDNPSHRAVNELYSFLEESDLPITEDGHFMAYKRVANNFRDIYSGKMDNSPGQIVSMPRNQVNEDKDQTCSTGLHFCSRSYLSSYGTDVGIKTVLLKINPRDVVSIPSDYNNAKGRCCRYEVIKEIHTNTNDNNMPEKIEGLVTDSGSDIKNDIIEETAEKMNDVNEKLSSNNPLSPNVKADNDITAFLSKNRQPEKNNTIQITTNNTTKNQEVIKTDPNTGQWWTYASPQEAMKQTKIDASSIRKVCNKQRKTAGGYIWSWASSINDIIDIDDASREEEYDE